tara:strand:+ start:59267 stop:59989 length:723 start_codon:yes stop_codon:yes gene_type:complete
MTVYLIMKNNQTINMEQTVSEFLKENPTYLYDHAEILENLYLPHATGSAISLVERQVAILRERNKDLRNKLELLSSQAIKNEERLVKTQNLILAMLNAPTINRLKQILLTDLHNSFDVEFCSLTILTGDNRLKDSETKSVPLSTAKKQISSILSSKVLCGIVREGETQFLFGDAANKIGSVATVVIGQDSPIAVLALGNRDKNFYTADTGALFLSYLGSIIDHILQLLIKKSYDHECQSQ